MEALFYNCSSLKTINLSNFDTSNVKNMGHMFHGCSKLISFDIDSFNTTNRKNNSIKRGVSGSALFDSIRKSNTKVGTIQKIEGKRSDYKAKRISQWKKIFQYNAQKNENRQQPILNLNLNINEKKERNISFIDINKLTF